MFKIKNILIYLTMLVSFTSFESQAGAKPPILIEFFGQNSCASDTVIQESLQKIVQSNDNVHIINCRTHTKGSKEVKTFTLQFCTKRKRAYDLKFGNFSFNTPAALVVNGRWDANSQDIKPALKLGRMDNIQSIALNLHDRSIDISIPKIESKIGHGEILIYTYLPTLDEKAVFIDSDVSLTEEMKEKINKNRSVPFVTKARTAPFYFRPVLATERVGHWSGNAIDLTFSLNDITSMSGASYANLSYIVVLYEGDEMGNVLAAGEHVSLKEFNNTLPHNEPKNIKLLTPDPKNRIR